jgi:hypothetical protein
MYGPLGQVNNQFQANLGQNAAAMGQQQNYYNQVGNIGAYNQGVTDNLYGPGGFGGDTAKYAYAGAAYGRDTGGFNGGGGGYEPTYGDYGGDWQSGGGDWQSGGGGAPAASFNDRYSFGGDYAGLPSEIMTGQSDAWSAPAWQPAADPGGIRGGMGGGAWDTQDQWGRGYTPPVQNYGGWEPASAYPLGGGGALPDYNSNMWGGLDYATFNNIRNGFDPNGNPTGSPQAAAQAYGVPFDERFSAFSPGTGSSYGPGYFDNTFGAANDMQSSRDAIARAWMNNQMAGGDSRYTQGGNIYTFGMPGSGQVGPQADTFTGYPYGGRGGNFDYRWGGGLNYGGGDLGAGIQSLQDALGILNSVPDWQSSTYTQPPEDNRWGGG